jgi:nicotinamidase-related amidase
LEDYKVKKWQAIFKSEDRALAKKAGFGKKQNFGKKPALLVVDMNRSFLGSPDKDHIESVKEYRTCCGKSGWKALEHIEKLIEVCREKKIPVVFSTNDAMTTKFSRGPDKIWGTDEKLDPVSQEIIEKIKPLPNELIIYKTKASCFFGTSLVSILNHMKIDTLFVIGTSTSGCVRATVVDAMSYNFTVFIVEDCTFDRFELSHLVSLWDMHMKYADVISLKEVIKYLILLQN